MIRTRILTKLFFALALISFAPKSESQEIRLQPPQLEGSGGVSGLRAGGRSVMPGRAMLARAGQATRMGVSRVARQTPIQAVRPRGIYAAFRQDGAGDANAGQGNVLPNNAAQGNPIIQDEMIIPDDYIIEDDGAFFDDGVMIDEGMYPGYPQFQLVSFADMEYFVGVQGFKSVPNLGASGSFGFNEGINWGFPMPILPLLGLSGQIGFRFSQSDFNGWSGSTDNRDQFFLTGGISRRVDYGLQMGVAVDYLNDNWYHDASFAQLRSEIGFIGGFGNQLGFRFMSNLDSDPMDVATGLAAVGFTAFNNFEPLNTYRFFYRQQWDQVRGGYVECMAGFSGNGDGMVGADFQIPIAERWALSADFTGLFPSTGDPTLARIDESWNVGIGLTWYPKGLSTWSQLYHRPLFDVADNGTFMFSR